MPARLRSYPFVNLRLTSSKNFLYYPLSNPYSLLSVFVHLVPGVFCKSVQVRPFRTGTAVGAGFQVNAGG